MFGRCDATRAEFNGGRAEPSAPVRKRFCFDEPPLEKALAAGETRSEPPPKEKRPLPRGDGVVSAEAEVEELDDGGLPKLKVRVRCDIAEAEEGAKNEAAGDRKP